MMVSSRLVPLCEAVVECCIFLTCIKGGKDSNSLCTCGSVGTCSLLCRKLCKVDIMLGNGL